MLPMMAGMLTLSIVSGQIISRTGRYKYFPIIGTAVMTAGLYFLSLLSPNSSNAMAASLMLVLGVGLGMVMQVLVIAVQNDVDYRDLGVATSGATLFRLVGGSLGTAVLGAVFASRLAARLHSAMPNAGSGASPAPEGMSIQSLANLPPGVRASYATAFTGALDTVFLVAALVCGLGFVLSWLMPERALRTTVASTAGDPGHEAGEAFARPAAPDGVIAQIYGVLSREADRDVQRKHIQRIVARAGETLTPAAAWLLVRAERDPKMDPFAVGRSRDLSSERVAEAVGELRRRALVDVVSPAAGRTSLALTDSGCDVLRRLVAARREHLTELAADWDPDRHPDLAAYLRDAARELVPDVRRAG
jgi:MFS family permease